MVTNLNTRRDARGSREAFVLKWVAAQDALQHLAGLAAHLHDIGVLDAAEYLEASAAAGGAIEELSCERRPALTKA